MEESTWGFIGVITGAIVGATTSIVTTILTSNNAARLQENTNAQERMERARLFQRETLLAVQETLNDSLRMMMVIYLHDSKSSKGGEEWGKSPIDRDIGEKARLNTRQLVILTERIADDSLREELKMIRKHITKISFCTSKKEAEALTNSTVSLTEHFMERLGITLRNLY